MKQAQQSPQPYLIPWDQSIQIGPSSDHHQSNSSCSSMAASLLLEQKNPPFRALHIFKKMKPEIFGMGFSGIFSIPALKTTL